MEHAVYRQRNRIINRMDFGIEHIRNCYIYFHCSRSILTSDLWCLHTTKEQSFHASIIILITLITTSIFVVLYHHKSRMNQFNVPYYKEMIQQLEQSYNSYFYGYVNSDIFHHTDLISILYYLYDLYQTKEPKTVCDYGIERTIE